MKVITTNLLNRFWTNGVKPLKEKVDSMATNFKTANNLTTTASGFALDARQGPVIQQKFNDINSDLDGCSFERREDGAYITYTPPGGADSVIKKLGSTILYVGSGSTIDIKSILPNEYAQLSINNFLTEITGTSVGWSKGGRASTTTPSYSLNKAYDSSTGIYTHNSKINNWTADVNEIKGGSDWAAGATAYITITTKTYIVY